MAITAPCGFVNRLLCRDGWADFGVIVASVEFTDKGAQTTIRSAPFCAAPTDCFISPWVFSHAKSNYGGSWNGVPGAVTGLFYGDAGQLVAQLMGVATLLGFVFTLSFILNMVIDVVVGQRSSAKAELEGLDIPEMGAVAYPDFVLKADEMGMD